VFLFSFLRYSIIRRIYQFVSLFRSYKHMLFVSFLFFIFFIFLYILLLLLEVLLALVVVELERAGGSRQVFLYTLLEFVSSFSSICYRLSPILNVGVSTHSENPTLYYSRRYLSI